MGLSDDILLPVLYCGHSLNAIYNLGQRELKATRVAEQVTSPWTIGTSRPLLADYPAARRWLTQLNRVRFANSFELHQEQKDFRIESKQKSKAAQFSGVL